MNLDDPPRLTDPASGAPDELRSLFDAGTRDVPSAGELARLATKLGPVLGPGAGATASGGSAAGVGKLALVVGALVGGALLVSSLTREVPTNVPDARPLPQKEVAPKPENPAKVEPPVATQAPAAEAPSAPPSTVERPVRRAEQLSNAELEVELLERARAALAGNPAHALSLTSEHKLRFPGGTLAQEREVIAIEALRRLGKNDQAALRADEFAKHYPGSAHRHKLDAGVTQ
jgi:outer membrane biosynthesis protein TonB